MWRNWFQKAPSAHTLQLQPSGERLQAQASESILQSALAQGLAFPHNCRVGGCGECKCKLLSGQVKELTDKSYLLSAEELQQGYILACQSRPRSDVVVEVRLGARLDRPPVIDAQAQIAGLQRLCDDIIHLRLTLDRDLAYLAGQCADIVVPAAAGVAAGQVRSYSFASAPSPGAAREVDFFVRKVVGGAFTEWLFLQARVGDTLSVRGPQGQFGWVSGGEPMLCLAGGSGLAPILAILQAAIAARQALRPLTLVVGARTQADLYAEEAIDQIRRQWGGRFVYAPILSAEPPGSGWAGRQGWVAEHLPALLGDRLGDQAAWVCGPPPMVDACAEALQSAGVPPARLHLDRFLDASHRPAGHAA